MEAKIDRLKSELAALPPADRADLAHFLIESLGDDGSIADDPAWEAEIRKERYDSSPPPPAIIASSPWALRYRRYG